jgi:hypothetical protein
MQLQPGDYVRNHKTGTVLKVESRNVLGITVSYRLRDIHTGEPRVGFWFAFSTPNWEYHEDRSNHS